MKKLLLTTAVLLLAAACNNKQAQVQHNYDCAHETELSAGCAKDITVQSAPASQSSQAQPQVTSTDQTATWKTYKNTQYLFEFQYPLNWNYKINSGLSPLANPLSVSLYSLNDAQQTTLVNILLDSSGLTLKNYFKDHSDLDSYMQVSYSNHFIQGIRFSGVINQGPDTGNYLDKIVFKSPDNKYIFELSYESATQNQDLSHSLEQLASTFKFIK